MIELKRRSKLTLKQQGKLDVQIKNLRSVWGQTVERGQTLEDNLQSVRGQTVERGDRPWRRGHKKNLRSVGGQNLEGGQNVGIWKLLLAYYATMLYKLLNK